MMKRAGLVRQLDAGAPVTQLSDKVEPPIHLFLVFIYTVKAEPTVLQNKGSLSPMIVVWALTCSTADDPNAKVLSRATASLFIDGPAAALGFNLFFFGNSW